MTSDLGHSIQRGNLLRVGDIAKATGKTVRAIHLYEELGLLAPVTRSSGGFRLYDPAAIERVRPMIALWGKTLTIAGDKPGAAQVLKLTNKNLERVSAKARDKSPPCWRAGSK